MKYRTKVILCILVALLGMILMINHLYDKEETINTINNTTNSVIKEFIDVSNTTTTKKTKTTKNVVKTTEKITTKKIANTNTGYNLTHYGYDCSACSGTTAKGYDISKTIYYNDKTYGKVRVVAMCSKYPFYSIIKIKNYKNGGDITAIVLDRGVGCSTIDLAVKNEKQAAQFGIRNNVQIEILRKGR